VESSDWVYTALKVQIAQAGKPVPPMPFVVLGEPEAHEWLVAKSFSDSPLTLTLSPKRGEGIKGKNFFHKW